MVKLGYPMHMQAIADLHITCRLTFISEPHGTHKMLLETSPRYEWATKWDNYCTYAYKNPRWRPRMHVSLQKTQTNL